MAWGPARKSLFCQQTPALPWYCYISVKEEWWALLMKCFRVKFMPQHTMPVVVLPSYLPGQCTQLLTAICLPKGPANALGQAQPYESWINLQCAFLSKYVPVRLLKMVFMWRLLWEKWSQICFLKWSSYSSCYLIAGNVHHVVFWGPVIVDM